MKFPETFAICGADRAPFRGVVRPVSGPFSTVSSPVRVADENEVQGIAPVVLDLVELEDGIRVSGLKASLRRVSKSVVV